MTGVILLAHGSFGESLVSAVEMIAGTQPQVSVVGLHVGDSVEAFEERFHLALDAVDSGDGVLILADFYGGTPSNTAMRYLQRKASPCVAGVNLPMLIEVLTSRDIYGTDELRSIALKTGASGVLLLNEKAALLAAEIQNDF